MSNKLPMVSLEKVEVKLTMKVETVVAVDKVAHVAGLSRASVINGYVEDGLRKAKVALTAEDVARIDEIKAENAAKRKARKAAKGVK